MTTGYEQRTQQQEKKKGRAGSGGARAKKLLAVGATALLASLAAALPALAATPPAFPNNIVVFPERDFVVLEGYEKRAGQSVTVTVTRGGVVTSTATGKIGAGDPSLEINHPGGVCWKGVTPDIKPGDKVTAAFRDGRRAKGSDSTVTQDAAVTDFAAEGADKLVVNGKVGPGVNTAFLEQRIINPDLDTTGIGRRDVRAPERDGPYTSTLTFPTPGTFQATYTFQDDPATTDVNEGTEMRDVAKAGQMRVLAWQAQDRAGNRQGLTIFELDEVGGPGMGGCPPGPASIAPNAPTNVKGTPLPSSIGVNWTGSTIIPDGSPVTGYEVTAIDQASGLETSRIVGADAKTATIPATKGKTYKVQVTASSAAGPSKPGSAGLIKVTQQ